MRGEAADDTTSSTTSGPRSRGSSPAVDASLSSVQMRQALNKLDEDGETGRDAMNSLKQCVEAMDPTGVPRFVSQVSETKEKGNSNSKGFAISLYEEVARVHGKLIVRHIPRIMTTLKRSLSASGSSPQLPQACVKVVLAIAKHAIDDEMPVPPNSLAQQSDGGVAEDFPGRDGNSADVLKHLCDPLLGVLGGKLEPVAAGAAMCLQALVESQQWRHAPDDLVQNVFTKAAAALAERSTKTVAHLQLAKALSASNPSFLSLDQDTTTELFLKAASLVLMSSATNTSWQQRESAAQLVTAIFSNVDSHAVAEDELQSTMHALESCKLDRTSNVRAAVKEALRAARSLFEEEEQEKFVSIDSEEEKKHSIPQEKDVQVHVESLSPAPSPSPSREPPIEDIQISPYPSPTPSVIPLSPSAPSTTPPRIPGGASSRRTLHRHNRGISSSSSLRSPLRVATQRHHIRSAKSLSAFQNYEPPRKENLPSSIDDDEGAPVGKGLEADVLNMELVMSSPTESRRGWSKDNDDDRWMRNLGNAAAEVPASADHLSDMETSPGVISGRRSEYRPCSPVDGTTRENEGQQEVGDLSEDEDMCLFESNPTVQDDGSRTEEDEERFDDKPRRVPTMDSPSGRGAVFRSHHGVLDNSSLKRVFELKGPAVVGGVGRSPSRVIDVDKNSTASLSPARSIDGWRESSIELLSSPLRDDSPAHLTLFQDTYSPSPQVTQPLIDPKEIAAHSTPRSLVRSLQQKFSSPQPETPQGVVKARHDDNLGAAELVTTDMDVETPTSTSTGWSVRTNPIASDESLRTDSEDSDHDRGRTVWKKMVLGSSISPPLPAPRTPPAQETDNPDTHDIFRQRLAHPSSPASLDAPRATPTTFTLPSVEPLVPKTLFKEDDSPSGHIFTTTPDREERVALVNSELSQEEFLEASDSIGEACAELLREPSELDDSEASGQMTPLSPRIESSSGGATLLPQARMVELSNGSARVVSETSRGVLRNGNGAAPKSLSNSMGDSTENLGGPTRADVLPKSKYSLLKWHMCILVVGVPLAIVLSKHKQSAFKFLSSFRF